MIKDHIITEEVPIEVLRYIPIFALFMSANWCPPCKGLLPCLKKFYSEVNSKQ
jgi:thiol-disulfide isomerase/thioredoxin